MATHTDEKLELLKRVPLLSALGRREIEEVGRLAEEIDVPSGKVLMREGDTGREFYVLVNGSVGIDRGGTTIRTIRDGDFFGEANDGSDITHTRLDPTHESVTPHCVERHPLIA